jgi:hypothetical protein
MVYLSLSVEHLCFIFKCFRTLIEKKDGIMRPFKIPSVTLYIKGFHEMF